MLGLFKALVGLIGASPGYAFNNAIRFSGSNSIHITDDAALVNPVQPFTVSFWIRPITQGLDVTMELAGPNNAQCLKIYHTNYGTPDIGVGIEWGANGGVGHKKTGVLFTTGTWNHVGIIFDGSDPTDSASWKFVLNGVDTPVINGTDPLAPSYTNTTTRIGAADSGTNGTLYGTNSDLDDLAIWSNQALSVADLQAIHNGGEGADPSTFGTPGPNRYYKFDETALPVIDYGSDGVNISLSDGTAPTFNPH